DPLSPEAIQRYFGLLYWKKGREQLDVPNIMGLLKGSSLDSLPMETIASKFRMIDSAQMPVIVPYDDTARKALRERHCAPGCAGSARRMQPYLVPLPKRGFDALYTAGAIAPVAPKQWGEQFMELV